jgi:hypothetical protein
VTCAWFVTGAVLGGLVLGAGTAVLALLVGGLPAWVALVAIAVAVASDLRLGGFALPVHPRQVAESWLRTYRPWVYGLGFGVQIGVGFATYVMTAATYLVVVLAALTGSWQVGLLSGVVFGLVRGLAVLLSATTRTPADLMRLYQRLEQTSAGSRGGVIALELLAAVALQPAAAVPALALVLVRLARRSPRRGAAPATR